MRLIEQVFSVLSEPRLRGVSVDSDALIQVHRAILKEKPMLREVFKEFYDLCYAIDSERFSGTGLRLEIGAGVSLFKSYYPDIVSTDIKQAPHLDRVLDAQNMDLPDASVRGLYGINCFHHFPDPARFFRELSRTLVPGGGCVLIEPFHGAVASRFYRHVFKTEHFNQEQQDWRGDDNTMDVMSGANQALSYLVFTRDQQRFTDEFPQLELLEQRPLDSYLRYLASGGLNFRAVAPNILTTILKLVETGLKPLNDVFALHHVIVLRKRTAGGLVTSIDGKERDG